MKNPLQLTHKGRMMIGQAGVFRVASRLLLLGHVPSFPSVDAGVDVLLDNGLRIQVKCCHLRQHKGFPVGAYCFSTHENNRNGQRDWSKVCDYIVFWGIEEDRFFVLPANLARQSFWIQPKSAAPKNRLLLLNFEERWDFLNLNQALASIEAVSAELSEV